MSRLKKWFIHRAGRRVLTTFGVPADDADAVCAVAADPGIVTVPAVKDSLKRVLRSHTAVIVPNAVLIPLGAGFSIDIRKRTGTKWTVSLCHNLTVLVTTDVRRITRS